MPDQVRDEDAQPHVVVVVAKREPHRILGLAVLLDHAARLPSDVTESAVAAVLAVEVRTGLVDYVEVLVVIVVVAPDGAATRPGGVAQPGGFGGSRELPVSEVPQNLIAGRFPSRSKDLDEAFAM